MAAIDLTPVTFPSILRELGLRILAPVLLIVAPAFSLVAIFGNGFPLHWVLVALTIGAVPIGATLAHTYLKNRYPHIAAFARLRPMPSRTTHVSPLSGLKTMRSKFSDGTSQSSFSQVR